MKPPRLVYSTPAPDTIAAFVAARYDLPGPLRCTFLRRGFNDCFALHDADGRRFIFRLSGWRLRGKADVDAETAFIAHLDGCGVPVAMPISTRSGARFTRMPLPQGSHPAVLFRFIEGRTPENQPGDAHQQGVTLARIHSAADRYADRDHGRSRNDLDNLLHAPLSAVLNLDFVTEDLRNGLIEIAECLTAKVKDFDLAWTRCHGDCHGGNARIPTDGPLAGQAAFFDFDDGGPGYVAYDLSVFLWAQMSFGRRRPAQWHAFIDGYRSIRPLKPADFEATHAFVAIRHIWLMGQWAYKTAEWGSDTLSAAWMQKELRYLQSWLRDRVSPGLLELR